MNKIIRIFSIVICFAFLSNFATAQKGELELGVRYLKLGNSYREAKNFDKAKEYLTKGFKRVDSKSLYWKAAALEYLGYYYRDAENDIGKAIQHLDEARLIFEKVVKQNDGSQEALEEVMDRIQYLSINVKELEKSEDIEKVEIESGSSVKSERINYKGGAVGNYDNQKLRQLPPDLDESIENLSLANNKFRDFPNRLLDFSNLQFLNLSNNKIKKLPQDINDLSKLIYLDLYDNDLEEIPRDICGCENLQVLNLKGNEINFESLTNIIRCLPNTNILFDEYEPKSEEETEDYLNY